MRFLCPYCKHDLGSEPRPKCPQCGRIMAVPGPLRKPRSPRRSPDHAAKAGVGTKTGPPRPKPHRSDFQIRHDRELARFPAFLLGRKPSHLLFILAVMAVIGGILIGKAGRRTSGQPVRVIPESVAEREVDVLRVALERFRTDCGRDPTTSEGLDALVNDPGLAGWQGPYIKLLRPDPWRTRYVYKEEKGQIALFSAGPDRAERTQDDILPEAMERTSHARAP